MARIAQFEFDLAAASEKLKGRGGAPRQSNDAPVSFTRPA